ncbi:MAG TPA: hypothetical protein VHW02_10940 [Rhizomicrobium sp.]|jgi:hypothetical protein|nr:hypothetical protein [Rhizomicrobium sp.]
MDHAAIVFGAVALITAGTAPAGDDVARDFMPATIVLAATGGHFNKWQKDLPCTSGVFNTDLQISDPDYNSTWETASQIVLRSKSGAAVFQVRTVQHASPMAANLVIRDGGQGEILHRDFQTTFNFEKSNHVAVSWNASGMIKVSINDGDTHDVSLDQPLVSLELVGSGGKAVFSSASVNCTNAQ